MNDGIDEMIFEVDGDMYFNASDISLIVNPDYLMSLIDSNGSEYMDYNSKVLFKIMDLVDVQYMCNVIVKAFTEDIGDETSFYIDDDNNVSIDDLKCYVLEVFGRIMRAFDNNDILDLPGHNLEYGVCHAFMHSCDEKREDVLFELNEQDIVDIAMDKDYTNEKIIKSYMNGREFEWFSDIEQSVIARGLFFEEASLKHLTYKYIVFIDTDEDDDDYPDGFVDIESIAAYIVVGKFYTKDGY